MADATESGDEMGVEQTARRFASQLGPRLWMETLGQVVLPEIAQVVAAHDPTSVSELHMLFKESTGSTVSYSSFAAWCKALGIRFESRIQVTIPGMVRRAAPPPARPWGVQTVTEPMRFTGTGTGPKPDAEPDPEAAAEPDQAAPAGIPPDAPQVGQLGVLPGGAVPMGTFDLDQT